MENDNLIIFLFIKGANIFELLCDDKKITPLQGE